MPSFNTVLLSGLSLNNFFGLFYICFKVGIALFDFLDVWMQSGLHLSHYMLLFMSCHVSKIMHNFTFERISHLLQLLS